MARGGSCIFVAGGRERARSLLNALKSADLALNESRKPKRFEARTESMACSQAPRLLSEAWRLKSLAGWKTAAAWERPSSVSFERDYSALDRRTCSARPALDRTSAACSAGTAGDEARIRAEGS